jgi:hypothetical protein
MMDTLTQISKSDDEAELDFDCGVKTVLCQNDAFMASLPFNSQ